MSDPDRGNGGKAAEASGAAARPARDAQAEALEPALPPVVPPLTKAPVQFNQLNIYQQIPQSAWDRLTPDQVVELSKYILTQMDATDKRHFDFATEDAKRAASGKTVSVLCGSLVAVVGFVAAGYLALQGHDTVAFVIALPITTVLAMIIGNRFLG